MTCDFERKADHAPVKRFQQLLTGVVLFIRGIWIRLAERDKVTDEAMQWVITIHGCDDLDPILPAFHEWLSTGADNRDRFMELWDFWQELGTLTDRHRWTQSDVTEDPVRNGTARKPFPWRQATGATAVAGLTLIIVLYLAFHTTQALATGQRSTAAGETARLGLVDGSTVILSEASQVTVDLGMGHRRVRLDRGEASFKVAKSQTPFEVSVNADAIIRAVGTEFAVKKGPDSTRIEVRDGAVDLIIEDQEPVQVKAGQVAEFSTKLIRISDSSSGQTTADVSPSGTVWLIFRGESLSDAAGEINRYNSKRRIVVDENIPDRTVRGRFSATNPKGFADTVAVTLGLKCFMFRDARTGTEIFFLSIAGAQRSSAHHTRRHTSVEEQQ